MTKIERVIYKIKVILQENRQIRINDAEVAKVLGLTPQNLSNFKSNGNIPYEQLTIFLAKKKININWVLFDQLTSSLEDPTMRYVGIKYLATVNGSCGGGCIFDNDEQSEIVKFPWYMVEELKEKSNLNNLHIINVIGDSMEPALLDKDRVFVDSSKIEINAKDIFVISTPNGIFIKKIKVTEDKITL